MLGIDSNAAGMAAAASRAARRPRRGGLANARFIVSAVEALPAELARSADLVTIQLPWAALLRGLLQGDGAVIGPIAALMRFNGELRLLLSATEREAGRGLDVLDELAVDRLTRVFEAHGLRTIERRRGSAADVGAAGSSWARRLGIGLGERAAWSVRFRAPRR